MVVPSHGGSKGVGLPREVRGVPAAVATVRPLHRRKRGAARPKDRLEAAILREAFDLEGEPW
ncbi:MAG: hypothetical protein MUF10_14760 [Thermoanaerobaculaceae bacterium]|nr:hypothetical protein [Thermoanaerobaculaceae bacterium]